MIRSRTVTDRKLASGAAERLWKWVRFDFKAEPGSEVLIAGTFNGWKPSCFDKLRDRAHDGTYGTLLKLRRGRHEYKFIVDGRWLSQNGESAPNSVMDVA
jgi:hypothetical protein